MALECPLDIYACNSSNLLWHSSSSIHDYCFETPRFYTESFFWSLKNFKNTSEIPPSHAGNLPKISCINFPSEFFLKNSPQKLCCRFPNNFTLTVLLSRFPYDSSCVHYASARKYFYAFSIKKLFWRKYPLQIPRMWCFHQMMCPPTLQYVQILDLSNYAINVSWPMFGRFSNPTLYLSDCRLPLCPPPASMRSSNSFPLCLSYIWVPLV